MESYVLRVATIDEGTGPEVESTLRGEIRLVRTGRTVVFRSSDELLKTIVQDLDRSSQHRPC